MSYAPARSENGSLKNGMTDGSHKKLNRDRGGFVETTTEETRERLNSPNFGYVETSFKVQPDGTVRHGSGNVYYHSPMKHQG